MDLVKGELHLGKLKLYAGILEGVLNKTEKNRLYFYSKRINYLILNVVRQI